MHVSGATRSCSFFLLMLYAGTLSTTALAAVPIAAGCRQQVLENPGRLLFLTGPPGGTYLKVGKAIAFVARKYGIENLDVSCATRTFDNIYELRKGHAAFALMQSDVAHSFWYRHTRFSEESDNPITNQLPYLVAPLYIEAVHILVRPHLSISTPAELRHRRVWLGPAHREHESESEKTNAPPSGTEFTARRILEAAGLNSDDIDRLENVKLDSSRCPGDERPVRDLDFTEARNALLSMCLDAMFYVGMAPNDKVRDVLATSPTLDLSNVSAQRSTTAKAELAEARLLSLNYGLVRRLVEDGSYVEKLITSEDYGEDESTLTVGVQALLLGRNDADNKIIIKKLATIIREHRAEIEAELKMKPPSNLSLLGMPVRPRLLKNAPSTGPPYAYNTFVLVWIPFWIAIAISVLTLSLIIYLRRAYVGKLIAENNFLIPAIVGLLILWVGSAFLLHQFEGEVNEPLSSFPRALHYSMFYLAPWLNYPTLTENGQLTQRIGQWIVGVVLLGGVFAPFVTGKVIPNGLAQLSSLMMRRGKVPRKLAHHIVIINYSPRTEDLIRKLHSPQVRAKHSVVVISQSSVTLPNDPEFNDVFVESGDVTDECVLQRAQLERAHSLAILSAWQPVDSSDRRKFLRGEQADSRTISAIQGISSFLSNGSGAVTLPIVAELKSRKHLRAAELAARGSINLICDEDLGIELLTQGVAAPGLTKLYKQIINCSDNHAELHRVSLPSECVGKVFQSVIVYFANRRGTSKIAEIPIGLYRESTLFVNPVDRDIGPLRASDDVLVLAERTFSGESFSKPNPDGPLQKPAA